jgi:hypothetical protein
MKSMKPTPNQKAAKKVAKIEGRTAKKIGKIAAMSDTKMAKLADKASKAKAQGNEYKASVLSSRRTLEGQGTAGRIKEKNQLATEKSQKLTKKAAVKTANKMARVSARIKKKMGGPMTPEKLEKRRENRKTAAKVAAFFSSAPAVAGAAVSAMNRYAKKRNK